jgi:nitrite reductase (NO-forming)
MKYIIIIVLVVIAIGASFTFSPKSSVVPATVETAVDNTQEDVQVFDIKGLDYDYDIKEIRVRQGTVVQINFTNTEGFHDLVIDEFNVATKQIPVNQSETITFVADKAGTFEYYCSVGKHRANGMWGKLIVE